MTQFDFGTMNPATTSGTLLADIIGDVRDAVNSVHKGASRPSYAVAGLVWIKDVSATVWEFYVYDGADDIKFGVANPTANTFQAIGASDIAGATITGAQMDVASAATTDLGAVSVTSDRVRITGIVTINSFGIIGAGVRRYVRFAASLTLTYNVTSMILPGNANIVTAADDEACFVSLGSGNWKCLYYMSQAVRPVLANVANTFTAQQIMELSSSSAVPLVLRSTNDDAVAGPILDMDRNPVTQSASDNIGLLRFLGRSSTGVQRAYAQMGAVVTDPTNTSEDGYVFLQGMIAGVITTNSYFGAGVQVGPAPPGGDPGVGRVNVETQYRLGGKNHPAIAVLQDQKTDGTDGGSPTAALTWESRDLQTELFDPEGIVTIASNQFTLVPGKYIAHAVALHGSMASPASMRLRIRNITDSVDVALSNNGSTGNPATAIANFAVTVAGYIDISASKAFAVQDFFTGDTGDTYQRGSDDLMAAGVEIYMTVIIQKVG